MVFVACLVNMWIWSVLLVFTDEFVVAVYAKVLLVVVFALEMVMNFMT